MWDVLKTCFIHFDATLPNIVLRLILNYNVNVYTNRGHQKSQTTFFTKVIYDHESNQKTNHKQYESLAEIINKYCIDFWWTTENCKGIENFLVTLFSIDLSREKYFAVSQFLEKTAKIKFPRKSSFLRQTRK